MKKMSSVITWVRGIFDAVTVALLILLSTSPAFAQTTTTGGTGLTASIQTEASSRLPTTATGGTTNTDIFVQFMTWGFFIGVVYFGGTGILEGMRGRGWNQVGLTVMGAIGAIILFQVISSATK
jgi:hypothetical protein